MLWARHFPKGWENRGEGKKKFLVKSAMSHGVVSCTTLDEPVFQTGQDGRDPFCLGSREPGTVSRGLTLDVGFKEQEEIFF